MKKALLWCLLALVVASCGDDEPAPEPLPTAQGELLSVPCEAPRLVLEVRITTSAPVEAWECVIGRPAARCSGLPSRIDSEWRGRVYCEQEPGYTTDAMSCIGKAVSDGRTVALDGLLAPGFAPNYNGNDYIDGCPPPAL